VSRSSKTMPQKQSTESPVIAADPDAELALLIERSIELTGEVLEVNKRIREVHEQIAQRHQTRAVAEDEKRGK
jgi:hypothetical protein